MTQTEPPQLVWHDPASPDGRAANSETARALGAMIDGGQRAEVTRLVEQWAPSAVLDCFAMLKPKRAQKLLKWVSEDLSLRLLNEVDPDFRHVLFEEGTQAKFAKVLHRKERHAAARFLLSLPAEYAELIVDSHPDAAWLREVLADADSALAAMKRGAVIARDSGTIGDVIEDIRARDAEIRKIDSLHVVDDAGRLTGYLKLRDLILNPPETPIAQVARPDPLTVTRDTDREAVLRLAETRSESIIAVVNHDGILQGVIAPDELRDIARREAEEDMLLMAGVSPESSHVDSPREIVARRLPWLLVGLGGAMVTALVIGGYEESLAQAAVLASFIPVVSATAGNASMQASTISIQALGGNKKTGSGGFWGRLGREMTGALVNGLAMGGAILLLVLSISLLVDIERPLRLAATAALAQVSVIIVAGTLGTVIPFVLHRLRFDPAVATGIFILTLNDVFGVLILFVIAQALYL